jgi:hypothetical protein
MNAQGFFLHGLFSPHSGDKRTLQTQLHWTFRVTVALCFIGHGTWGLITKSGWLPFFASQGIEPELAWTLQPIIGAFDIIMAFLLLWRPNRAILIWMFLWAIWTAMLRPLAGNLEKVEVYELTSEQIKSLTGKHAVPPGSFTTKGPEGKYILQRVGPVKKGYERINEPFAMNLSYQSKETRAEFFGKISSKERNERWWVPIRGKAKPEKTQTWEFWERAGNWGPPFMLLIMGGAFALRRKDLLGNYEKPEIKDSTVDTIFFLCKLCLALLLIGHAGFGFAVQKQMLISHWQAIGITGADATFISQVGYAEFALGVLIFLAPIRPLIFLALGWKLFTEFLYVPADTVSGMGIVNIFEWIERWGDFGIPLAMLYILSYRAKKGA